MRGGFFNALVAASLSATLLSITGPAAADDGEPAQAFSLTVSPLHLILPVLEVMGELRASDSIGVGVIGGFGSASAETSTGQDVTFDVFEVGGQVLFYPLSDFESLHLGVELLYLSVKLQDDTTLSGQQVDALASGLLLGPLVGYKLLTDGGFTLYVQGGLAITAVEAKAEASDGSRATAKENRFSPLLNLNLGGSF